jgi:hypothetical protein
MNGETLGAVFVVIHEAAPAVESRETGAGRA